MGDNCGNGEDKIWRCGRKELNGKGKGKKLKIKWEECQQKPA
jgi:hypothetical protein